ncbi:MAG: glutamate 5-kinase [Phycisphaerae bacterium]|nr:glutamate 5-kinase [Phycisphaerae bacterium]
MRNFTKTKRIVIKVGTSTLTGDDGLIDIGYIDRLARQIALMVNDNHQVMLVSSGAIGMGASALNIIGKVKNVKTRQACAAVGQGILMRQYQKSFARYGLNAGQILLTNTILNNRKYYVNLKNAVETMLAMKVVPVVNENDCISVEEIDLAFGDNDKLSALVASKIDAELLIILTDVDGLYDKNPKKSKDARLIEVIHEITDKIEAAAGDAGSALGTGGMKSKLAAIKIAAQGGCKVILAPGYEENVIDRIIAGENIGTLFMPKRRLSNRKRWILNSKSVGSISIDGGAIKALQSSHSLLTVGITAIEGKFKKGDVVNIADVAKGIARFDNDQLNELLKTKNKTIAVHINDLVLL